MNEFDSKAGTWDENPMHFERSKAIASKMREMIPIRKHMVALELGAGTGFLSLLLKDDLSSITLLDGSREMVRIMKEKIRHQGIHHIQALLLDLEKDPFQGKFDIIYSQMVFHHIIDIDGLLRKFYDLLTPGGYLAIADLYPEDGSFHEEPFTGHRGFDVNVLSGTLLRNHFAGVKAEPCFVIPKSTGEGRIREYPVFLMVAQKIS